MHNALTRLLQDLNEVGGKERHLLNANRPNPYNAKRGSTRIYSEFVHARGIWVLVWTDGGKRIVLGRDPWMKTVGSGI